MQSQGIAKSITSYPEGAMNAGSKFHSKPLINLMLVLEEKSGDHQSH